MRNTNVVGMSKEKLFDMWRNFEFLNIHATYAYFIFSYSQSIARCQLIAIPLINRSLQELFPMMIEDQDINTIFNFEVSVSYSP